MDRHKLKFTGLQQDILSIFFIYPEYSFNGRALARKLGSSATAISKSIKKLEKENLILVNRDETKRLSIKLNRDNKRVFELKRVENLKLTYESGLIDFLEDKFPGALIILFGSYSRGEDISNSDIDIAIIGVKEKEVDLSKYEKIFKREIFLHYYKNIKDIHKNLKESILSGIVFVGGIEL